MIRHIRGTVTQTHPTYTIIDVGGVGYLIYTTVRNSFSVNTEALLYTHLAVRENALDLYGFQTQNELSFFELLLTLPKVGPKTAMQILSQADISLMQNAIISQDAAHLSKMSGLSKKTAEKIVLGLKDTFEHTSYIGSDASLEHSQNRASFSSDAIDALITLGYSQTDARKAVQQLTTEKPEIVTVNDAIKEALKLLS
jgi:holliday junction DNA helicase RuvA